MSPFSRSLPGVVLAAGRGRRFPGGNKLLLPLAGCPLIVHTVQALLHSTLAPVLVVVGFEADRVERSLGGLVGHPKLRVVHNSAWWRGQASSIRAALPRLTPEAPGALFLPGDLPLMTPALLDRVARRLLATHRVCFALHRGRKGHPVAFPRELLPKLSELKGDQSGLEVVLRHWEEAGKLPLRGDEVRTQLDVDTEGDYARVRALWR